MLLEYCFGYCFKGDNSPQKETLQRNKERIPLINKSTLAYNTVCDLVPSHSKLFKQVLSIAGIDADLIKAIETRTQKLRIVSNTYSKLELQETNNTLGNLLKKHEAALKSYHNESTKKYPFTSTLSLQTRDQYKAIIKKNVLYIEKYFSDNPSQVHIIYIHIDPKNPDTPTRKLSIQLVKKTAQNGHSSISLYSVKKKGIDIHKMRKKLDTSTQELSPLALLFQLN